MEYYSAIKRSKLLIHITTWPTLQRDRWSRRGQAPRVTCFLIPLTQHLTGNPPKTGLWCRITEKDWKSVFQGQRRNEKGREISTAVKGTQGDTCDVDIVNLNIKLWFVSPSNKPGQGSM
jgi:hypothetical protein